MEQDAERAYAERPSATNGACGTCGMPKRIVLTAHESLYPRELLAHADLIVRPDSAVLKDRHGVAGRSATREEMLSCKTLTPEEAKIVVDEAAWRGQPPAEGTRRHLILEAIKWGDVLSDTEALEIADTVESALLRFGLEEARPFDDLAAMRERDAELDSARPDRNPLQRVVEGLQAEAVSAAGILDLMMVPRDEKGELLNLPGRLTLLMQRHAEALARRHAPAGDVPKGTREIHVVLKRVDDGERTPTYEFWEVEDQRGRGIRFPMVEQEGTQNLVHVVIPYARDDAWVAEVAYQAAGAATRAALGGRPAPQVTATVRKAVGELLAEFGLRCCDDCADTRIVGGEEPAVDEREHRADDPTLTMPPAGSRPRRIFDALRAEDVTLSNVAALSYAAAIDCALGGEDEEAADNAEPTPTEETYDEQLLREREEARNGEDHFKAQRDSALRLVRWLIGDVLDHPRFLPSDEGVH